MKPPCDFLFNDLTIMIVTVYLCFSFFFVSISHLLTPIKSIEFGTSIFHRFRKNIVLSSVFNVFFFVSLLIILHHILNELALEIWNHFFFFSTIKIIHFCTQTLKLHSSLAHDFTINKRQII